MGKFHARAPGEQFENHTLKTTNGTGKDRAPGRLHSTGVGMAGKIKEAPFKKLKRR